MEEQKQTPPPIIDQLKEYAETQIKLAKYEAIDRSAKFLASFVTDLVVGVDFCLTFLFFSFAMAFVLSNLLGSYWAGFGCMAGIYLIVALIIMAKEKIQKPLSTYSSKNSFNNMTDVSINNASDLKAEIVTSAIIEGRTGRGD